MPVSLPAAFVAQTTTATDFADPVFLTPGKYRVDDLSAMANGVENPPAGGGDLLVTWEKVDTLSWTLEAEQTGQEWKQGVPTAPVSYGGWTETADRGFSRAFTGTSILGATAVDVAAIHAQLSSYGDEVADFATITDAEPGVAGPGYVRSYEVPANSGRYYREIFEAATGAFFSNHWDGAAWGGWQGGGAATIFADADAVDAATATDQAINPVELSRKIGEIVSRAVLTTTAPLEQRKAYILGHGANPTSYNLPATPVNGEVIDIFMPPSSTGQATLVRGDSAHSIEDTTGTPQASDATFSDAGSRAYVWQQATLTWKVIMDPAVTVPAASRYAGAFDASVGGNGSPDLTLASTQVDGTVSLSYRVGNGQSGPVNVNGSVMFLQEGTELHWLGGTAGPWYVAMDVNLTTGALINPGDPNHATYGRTSGADLHAFREALEAPYDASATGTLLLTRNGMIDDGGTLAAPAVPATGGIFIATLKTGGTSATVTGVADGGTLTSPLAPRMWHALPGDTIWTQFQGEGGGAGYFNPDGTLSSDSTVVAADSDAPDSIAMLTGAGALRRSHADRFRLLPGAGAPSNGTTIAYSVGQWYHDAVGGNVYRADAKSNDPDVDGTGSLWSIVALGEARFQFTAGLTNAQASVNIGW